jgi:hypothetical protein
MSDARLRLRSLPYTLGFALACSTQALVLLGLGSCTPKPPPPKLPPSSVPRLGNVSGTDGDRADVILDAVQQGANLARLQYDCSQPPSEGIAGRGVLSSDITKCVFDFASKTLTISNDGQADCPTFLLTLNNYHGQAAYNTSFLGQLSLGTAKMRQEGCHWDGSMCLDWNGQSGPHPESSCTIEITYDPGVQYGTLSSGTVSGTFVCTDFLGPYKGCAGAPAKVACAVTRASFSVAGCTVINKPAEGPKKKSDGKKARGGKGAG